MTGRGKVEESANGPGHLGEPLIFQNVKRKTQLTLKRKTQGGGGKESIVGEGVDGWKIK